MFDEEERYRINVFDWNAAFPQIMKAGGFDAVIGNPPYVDVKLLGELMKAQIGQALFGSDPEIRLVRAIRTEGP